MFFNFAMAVSLVVVHDLNVGGARIGPRKTNTPLIIDAYCVLPFAVALQGLRTIRRRHPQIVETSGVIQHSQLAPRRLLNNEYQSLYLDVFQGLITLTLAAS
jgi:hypothetical protein